ncbi:hypothetical protein [Pseudomonas sp. PDM13]|uniref:hypothetical protein n=1 Tax=Pseudomonas sp. PDM13 TaxID=2769255 RepID=UPI0021E0DFFB|nr:hypothetical protein [Pseudomonas sp. PDM13]MCU9949730.1 hypothetical protein [Pseudomonas sp. PDM13]
MGFLDFLFNRKPSPDDFAVLFESAARKAGFKGELTYRPREFRLVYGESAFFNLHNAYREYCSQRGARRRETLNNYIAALCENQRSRALPLDEARPLLLPVIRSRGMIEELRLHQVRTEGDDLDFSPVYLPMGDDAVVLLAIDHPESTATLVQGPDKSWGITLEEGLAIALTNLRDTTADSFVEVVPGLFRGDWNDSYDISRIFLPDVLERLPLKGRPVFMVPSRETLLVTGDHDGHALAAMVELSLQSASEGRAISTGLYCYEDGKVATYPVQHPLLQARLARMRYLTTKNEYDTQKHALDLIHQENSTDIFVANYQLYAAQENPDQLFSIASWTEGVDSLLPRVDRLVLVRPNEDCSDAETRAVSWEQAMALLGDLLEEAPGFYPPRYRTLGFPEPSRAELLDEVN